MNTENIILSQKVMDFLDKIGFKTKNRKVISYFLMKDLTNVFGKNNFAPHEIEVMINVSENLDKSDESSNNRKDTSLEILTHQQEYQIYSNLAGTSLEMVQSDGSKLFTLKEYEHLIMNTMIERGEFITMKTHVVNIGKKLFFDYKEKIKNTDNQELSFTARRLAPLGVKFGNREIFNLEYLEMEYCSQVPRSLYPQTLSQKLRSFKEALQLVRNEKAVGVVTSYELTDLFDFLPQIYETLERENLTSKRKKIKKF